MPEGTELGVRPEHLRLDGDVPARVDLVEVAGGDAFVHLTGGLVARVAAESRPTRGRRGAARRPAARTSHLFDAATGERVERVSERRQLALMLAPYLLGLAVLVAAPGARHASGSRSRSTTSSGRPSFVGLDNFRELLDDDVFRIAVTNSLVFAAIAVPLRLAAALGLALLLHRRMRGRRCLPLGERRSRPSSPTSPTGSSGSGSSTRSTGRSTRFLGWGGAPNYTWIGYPLPQWLTHPNDARAAIIILSLFTIGEGFVVLLVTRQGLPTELYDLAALEDVTAWGLFRRVTLPLMAPVLLLLLARDTIFSLQATFVPALVVTDGGPPLYSTTYVPLFVYRNAFEYLRYGYAAAATLLMLALTAGIVLRCSSRCCAATASA